MNKRAVRKHVLRGYVVERAEGRHIAVCLKPYLIVEGRSMGEARHRMQSLINAYIVEACKDDHVHLLSRRASLRHYVRYVIGQTQSAFRSLSTIKPFTETCRVPRHA